VRRVLIFAALLSLLGLTTAFAASFDVQSEDIASFTTDVSISVPTAPPRTFYLKLAPTALPGLLDTVPPANNDSVQKKQLILSSASLADETDSTRYHMWETAPTAGDVSIGGTAFFEISQDGGADRVTAGLFICPAGTGPVSSGCTHLATATNPGTEGSGYKLRVIQFGALPVTTIPAGQVLRLKVINSTAVSTNAWTLQWGFNPARAARLEVGT
jgi:hypothetical protein